MENDEEAICNVPLCMLVFINVSWKIFKLCLHEDFCYISRRFSILYIKFILFVKTHFYFLITYGVCKKRKYCFIPSLVAF